MSPGARRFSWGRSPSRWFRTNRSPSAAPGSAPPVSTRTTGASPVWPGRWRRGLGRNPRRRRLAQPVRAQGASICRSAGHGTPNGPTTMSTTSAIIAASSSSADPTAPSSSIFTLRVLSILGPGLLLASQGVVGALCLPGRNYTRVIRSRRYQPFGNSLTSTGTATRILPLAQGGRGDHRQSWPRQSRPGLSAQFAMDHYGSKPHVRRLTARCRQRHGRRLRRTL